MDKNFFMRYRSLALCVGRLDERISELEARVLCPVSSCRAVGGGGDSDFTDIIVKIEELRAERAGLLLELAQIEKFINELSDPLQRVLLQYRYVDGLGWKQICMRMNYSMRQVHRIHEGVLGSEK